MRILVYIDGPEIPGALKEWASGVDGTVEWRNGRLFSAPERRADVVYTADPSIREAYDGVDVRPLPGIDESPRYVVEEGNAGWVKVKDTETGEYVDGASERSKEAAQQTADKLNAT